MRFESEAEIDGDTLTASATAQLKMSELGVGPITKVGLVSTGDDIEIALDLVAVDSRNFTPPTGLSLASVDTGFHGHEQPLLRRLTSNRSWRPTACPATAPAPSAHRC